MIFTPKNTPNKRGKYGGIRLFYSWRSGLPGKRKTAEALDFSKVSTVFKWSE